MATAAMLDFEKKFISRKPFEIESSFLVPPACLQARRINMAQCCKCSMNRYIWKTIWLPLTNLDFDKIVASRKQLEIESAFWFHVQIYEYGINLA